MVRHERFCAAALALLLLRATYSLPDSFDSSIDGWSKEGAADGVRLLKEGQKLPKNRNRKRKKTPKNPRDADTSIRQNVTPEVIFGTGNANGYFNTCRNPESQVEVGLRAKVRFDDNCDPFDCATNNVTCNADGTYSFDAEDACSNGTRTENCGWGNDQEKAFDCGKIATWSFDWTANVAYEHNVTADPPEEPANVLSDFEYELGVDCDPGDKTEYSAFDPITQNSYTDSVILGIDQAFSTNEGLSARVFTSGIDVSSASNADEEVSLYRDGYTAILNSTYVVQNSVNYRFLQFPGTCVTSFEPAVDGHYVVYFCVLEKGTRDVVCCSSIQVLVGDTEPLKKFSFLSGSGGFSSSS